MTTKQEIEKISGNWKYKQNRRTIFFFNNWCEQTQVVNYEFLLQYFCWASFGFSVCICTHTHTHTKNAMALKRSDSEKGKTEIDWVPFLYQLFYLVFFFCLPHSFSDALVSRCFCTWIRIRVFISDWATKKNHVVFVSHQSNWIGERERFYFLC